ncbi:MAG: prephenate dehydratase [Christensenellaceae bacterium]|jgi:chorismate mutase/prephenate dehydratase
MNLENIREEIDAVDHTLLQAFIKRMELSQEVAAYKAANNLPTYSKERERNILARVADEAGAYGSYARILYHTLFELSKSHQRQLRAEATDLTQKILTATQSTPVLFPEEGLIACQGVEGAYSMQAAEKLFPKGNIMYFKTFENVCAAVEQGLCRYGVLPVENSIHGTVNEVYDLMHAHQFHIVRSTKLQIRHALLAKEGVSFDDIKTVYSHPQALGQCSKFLESQPQIKAVPVENTAVSAKQVAERDCKDAAAIASTNCASLYDLRVLRENIENAAYNETRFICIAKEPEIYPGANRISILLSLPHAPGSLYTLISKFYALGINLTKLESRPIPGSDFSFRFYFDFDASVLSEEIVALLNELASLYEDFSFLGNYAEV